MFKEYQSKAITRLAYQVEEGDTISGVFGLQSTSVLTTPNQDSVRFKHYEPVKVGDYIVYLTEDDIYHCTEQVFLERNHV